MRVHQVDTGKPHVTTTQMINNVLRMKVGSNETVSYWSLGQKSILPNPAEGWVVVEQKEAIGVI